jgi:hypothetical protein
MYENIYNHAATAAHLSGKSTGFLPRSTIDFVTGSKAMSPELLSRLAV